MFGLDPALIGKVMAVVNKSKDITLGTCQGQGGVDKAFDELVAACELPGAEVRLLTLKIGGKSVVILGAGAPGTLAEIGM
jgi:hypothetical protein